MALEEYKKNVDNLIDRLIKKEIGIGLYIRLKCMDALRIRMLQHGKSNRSRIWEIEKWKTIMIIAMNVADMAMTIL